MTEGVHVGGVPKDHDLTDVAVLCPVCDWTGTVGLYDIGDGPEWCCPSCDMCFPSNAVRGPDGMTNAERRMFELARRYRPENRGKRDGDDGEAGAGRDEGGLHRPPG